MTTLWISADAAVCNICYYESCSLTTF